MVYERWVMSDELTKQAVNSQSWHINIENTLPRQNNNNNNNNNNLFYNIYIYIYFFFALVNL